MTVEACYKMMGGDYEDVIKRLMREDRVRKYLYKFADGQDYLLLLENLEAKNYENAFRYSHNLKGMSLNLAFTRLYQSSSELCESLKGGEWNDDTAILLELVKKDYGIVVDAIEALKAAKVD